MTEYGSLRVKAKQGKLSQMVKWKKGVSKEEHDKFVDEAIAERNAMKGMTRVLRHINAPVPPGELFPPEPAAKINDVATRDLIRHYANGIGDPNPLWRDEAYCRETRWGRITAPGPFLKGIAWGTMGYPAGSPPGTNWQFFKPIYVDDSFTVYDTLGTLEEVTKPEKPRQFLERNYRTYVNQRNEIVGIAERLMIQSIRPEGNPIHHATTELKHYKYTEEEIAAIEKDYENEVRRGALPRYWDHVNVGDVIPQVVKGPITVMDMVSFAQAGFHYPAHGLYYQYRKWIPSQVMIDPATGISISGGSMHYVDELARLVVTPVATAYGEQTIAWVGHMLTNWMGDDGFIRKLNTRFFRYCPIGDTVWCRGKVTRKYEEEGRSLVDIEFEVTNQEGKKHGGGIATVQLMAIGKGIMNI